MNFLNADFANTVEHQHTGDARGFREFYLSTNPSLPCLSKADDALSEFDTEHGRAGPLGAVFWHSIILSERAALNYSRNLLAYGVRAGMYAGTTPFVCSLYPPLSSSPQEWD